MYGMCITTSQLIKRGTTEKQKRGQSFWSCYPMVSSTSVLALSSLVTLADGLSFDVQSWQSTDAGFTFPEESLPEVQSAASVGITFSGGGDRSFIASIGYLAAMHELGMLEDVRYIVGVSGGAWATSVYSYYQNNAVSDDTMLGPVIMPQDIVYEDLKIMDPHCVRGYPNSDFNTKDLGPTYDDYKNGIDYIYLDPAGVKRGTPFSYNDDTVAEIKRRNPELNDMHFATVRGRSSSIPGIDRRPYPIVSTTLMSPYDLLPTFPSNRVWDLLEFTPLATGIALSDEVTYTSEDGSESEVIPKGGFVEPYAFGMEAPASGLGTSQRQGTLHIPDASLSHGDLLEAATSSSWAVGMSLATTDVESVMAWNGIVPYWSPSASTPTDHRQDFTFADGAGVSNTNIISLLQRKVKRIVAFVSTSTPLQGLDSWDPSSEELSKHHIDFTVPAWFGEIATDLNNIDKSSFDLENSQVFPNEDWLPFVQGLQSAQSIGKGNIYVHKHTTVSNAKYGIEAGQEVEMVWIYLGRCFEWEARLSEDMYDRVTPRFNKDDPANLASSGDFEDFPHYSTGVNGKNFQQANLLADLSGWIIHENKDYLNSFLHGETMDAKDTSDNDDGSSDIAILAVVLCVSASVVVVGAIILHRRRYFSQDAEGCVPESSRGKTEYTEFKSTHGSEDTYSAQSPVEQL